MKTIRASFANIRVMTIFLAFALTLMPQQSLHAAEKDIPEFSHDGMQRVINSKAAIAYIKPDTDFSGYRRFMILDCYVAFKKNWKKDYNREHRSGSDRLRDDDIERIRSEMAAAFREVFVKELSENDGYEVVDAAADDVLIIRLYIELYDSVSGEILARAIDRKADRSHGRMQWATRASNRADAKRILRKWAGWLRERMDEVSGKAG